MKNRIAPLVKKENQIQDNSLDDIGLECQEMFQESNLNSWSKTVNYLRSLSKEEFNDFREMDEYKSTLLFS